MEGALLSAGLAAFCVHSIRASRRETAAIRAEYDEGVPGAAARGGLVLAAGLVLGGLALLVVGARALVDSAVVIAQALGLDETVIALTIVSAGTSLPEVATSVVATLRGERDIAVGNVVGSSIFNVLGILGLTSLAAGGLGVAPAVESFDLPVMTAVAVACLPIMARGHRIPRFEGALFLAYYAAYVTYLVLAAKEHAALPRFSAVMLEFVVPLTVATLVAVALVARRPAAEPPAGS
jgi:cation:H+ antiporter